MAANDSIAIPPRVKDLTGRDDFGHWTVLSYAGLNARRKALWCCQCDCGTISILEGTSLRSGHSKSCGCLIKEVNAQHATTHGLSETPEYNSWTNIRQRCYNPANPRFRRYGGRNIRPCERWQSFKAFYEDLGPRPSAEHSVERRDNDGHYSCGQCSECIANNWPSNCYWATPKEQARNTSRNRLLTLNGLTMCMSEWAEHTGINMQTLYDRLNRGWSVEKALSKQ